LAAKTTSAAPTQAGAKEVRPQKVQDEFFEGEFTSEVRKVVFTGQPCAEGISMADFVGNNDNDITIKVYNHENEHAILHLGVHVLTADTLMLMAYAPPAGQSTISMSDLLSVSENVVARKDTDEGTSWTAGIRIEKDIDECVGIGVVVCAEIFGGESNLNAGTTNFVTTSLRYDDTSTSVFKSEGMSFTTP